MRILVRTSQWAIWSRRFAALALPLAIVALLFHRQGAVTPQTFIIVEIIALALAALAALMALVAMVTLWFTGDRGWWRAVIGLFFSIICLAPGAYFAYAAEHNRNAPDVTSDFSNPPALLNVIAAHFVGPEERDTLTAAYPDAHTRSYDAAATDVFDAISSLVDDAGWNVTSSTDPDPDTGGPGQLNAVVVTLLGFRQEVAIRVTGDEGQAQVDMRSASLSEVTDFGENGHRVEDFLGKLDAAVARLQAMAVPPADNDG